MSLLNEMDPRWFDTYETNSTLTRVLPPRFSTDRSEHKLNVYSFTLETLDFLVKQPNTGTTWQDLPGRPARRGHVSMKYPVADLLNGKMQ